MPMSQHFDIAFVHGGGQGGWVWEATIAALKLQTNNAVRALALDAPGCGAKRERVTDGIGMEEVARELVADIQAAGMSRVILVGHSQAGQALPAMAALQPGLFRRLVYVSCSYPLPGQTVLQMMGRGLHGSHADEVGWAYDRSTTPKAERFPIMFGNDMDAEQIATMTAKLGRDAWPAKTYSQSDWRYDQLGVVPATYVVCLQDMSLPVAWQEIFAARLKTERQVRIDAGHLVMSTRPQALAEVLRFEAR
jgi:pimeloyl-ACP methyl ester carboxylesterase